MPAPLPHPPVGIWSPTGRWVSGAGILHIIFNEVSKSCIHKYAFQVPSTFTAASPIGNVIVDLRPARLMQLTNISLPSQSNWHCVPIKRPGFPLRPFLFLVPHCYNDKGRKYKKLVLSFGFISPSMAIDNVRLMAIDKVRFI